ncbi:MAG: hypothetical protein LBT14_04090 [Treponema sp.]|jgi:hypothetical protein|nr:hypothetical protein [Treponema sp.]
MATVVLELPDFLMEEAKQKGVLSSDEYETFIRRRLLELDDTEYPPDFPSFLKGAVHPDLYGKGKINGDIIGPFYEEWGMKPPTDVPVRDHGK